jgi:hypothetical protein
MIPKSFLKLVGAQLESKLNVFKLWNIEYNDEKLLLCFPLNEGWTNDKFDVCYQS